MKILKNISLILLLSSSILIADNNKQIEEMEYKSIDDNTENEKIIINNNSVTQYYKLKKQVKKVAEQEKFDYEKKHIMSKLMITIGIAQQQYACIKKMTNNAELNACKDKYLHYLNQAVIKSRSEEMKNTEFDIDKGFD